MPTITDLIAFISSLPDLDLGPGREGVGVESVREWQGDLYVVTKYRGNAKKTRTGGGEFRIYVESGKFGPVKDADPMSLPEKVRAAVLTALGTWRATHGQEKGTRLAREEF